MTSALTPASIAWHQEKIALWSARAADLRAAGGRADANRALGLEWIVRGMVAALAASHPAVGAGGGTIARLEARLAACQPHHYAGTTVTVGAGPIMDAVRRDLRARLADLRGEPLPEPPAQPLPPVLLPPAEPVPFTAGPQLDLFGAAA